MISLWGSRRSGKTVFLSALWFAVKRRRGLGWRMLPTVGDTRAGEFIVQAFETFTVGSFPRPTDAAATLKDRTFTFDLRLGGPGLKVIIHTRMLGPQVVTLSFVDPAGEHFEKPDSAHATAVFEGLRLSRGLLCLIDPSRPSSSYFPLVLRNFTRIRDIFAGAGAAPGGFHPAMAVCVTKADLFPFDRGDESEFADVAATALGRSRPTARDVLGAGPPVARAVARQVMGPDAFDLVHDLSQGRLGWFLTSSVGLRSDGLPNVTRGRDDGELVPAGEPEPVNVLEPIEWLWEHMPAAAG